MKKFLVLCTCFVLLLALTGCDCNHSYNEWTVDTECHWHVCDKCGEEVHKEGHDFAKGNQCKVCEFYTYPDEGGRTVMESYDEEGGKSYFASYDNEGNLESYQRIESTYFDDGSIESMKSYGYDSLRDKPGTEQPYWENYFLPYEGGDSGEVYLHIEVMYQGDGTKITREYNQNNELVKEERS